MALMLSKLYDALREAGASESTARAAAEEAAQYENRFQKLEADHAVLKWMVGTNIALTLFALGALWQVLQRLPKP